MNSELFGHQRGASNKGYKKIKYGTLVLSTQNLHLGNANVNLRFQHGIVSPAYKTYDITGCNPDIMAHWIKSEKAKKFFFDATTVGASICRRNVEWDTLYSQLFFLPDIAEQKKIADFLSLISERLEAQRKLVESLKSYKRGVIFSLFKIENKYQIPMELTSMRSLLEEYRVRETEGLRVCSVAVEKGVVDQVEHLGRSYAASDTSKYGRVEPNYVIYTKSPTGSFPYGIVKQNRLAETVAVSPLYGVYKPRSTEDGMLLHYYFEQHENANNYIRPLAQKGAKNTINITTDKFLDSSIVFPRNDSDITRIIQMISTFDKTIALQERVLNSLENERKTILSQMFI